MPAKYTKAEISVKIVADTCQWVCAMVQRQMCTPIHDYSNMCFVTLRVRTSDDISSSLETVTMDYWEDGLGRYAGQYCPALSYLCEESIPQLRIAAYHFFAAGYYSYLMFNSRRYFARPVRLGWSACCLVARVRRQAQQAAQGGGTAGYQARVNGTGVREHRTRSSACTTSVRRTIMATLTA